MEDQGEKTSLGGYVFKALKDELTLKQGTMKLMTKQHDALLNQLEDLAIQLNHKDMTKGQLNGPVRICQALTRNAETEMTLRKQDRQPSLSPMPKEELEKLAKQTR